MKSNKVVVCSLLSMAMISGIFAADAPKWIGLDTTLRDQQVWIQPTEEMTPGSLDTFTHDFWKSLGETIRGTFYGMLFLFK